MKTGKDARPINFLMVIKDSPSSFIFNQKLKTDFADQSKIIYVNVQAHKKKFIWLAQYVKIYLFNFAGLLLAENFNKAKKKGITFFIDN